MPAGGSVITDNSARTNLDSSGAYTVTKSSTSGRRRITVIKERKPNEDQFMAAAIGDLEWLKHAIKENRGYVDFDKNGLAPVHIASVHGRLDCLKFLIEKMKVDINLLSTTGWQPVHLCISNQTGKRAFQCLEYILHKGGDPNAANEDGITPVHQAASEGHVQCLKALVEAGAFVDSKDRRGHLPIDLAKLWGHRKCARILAAEMWHQSKEYVAMEMSQLKKVKMQQALQDLAEEEERKAGNEFYGQLAFSNWLNDRELPQKNTGPLTLEQRKAKEEEERRKEAAKKKKGKGKSREIKGDLGDLKEETELLPIPESRGGMSTRETLHRTNSRQTTTPLSQRREDKYARPPPGPGKNRVQIASKKSFQTKKEESDDLDVPVDSEDESGLHENIEIKKKQTEKEHQRKVFEHKPYFTNPEEWHKSAFVGDKQYITNLKDCYPRDVYSCLPTHRSMPAELRVNNPLAVLTNPGGERKKLNITIASKLREPDLPKDVVEKMLARDPTKLERPVVHKCQNMVDVQTKHKYDIDQIPRSEITMHLSNAFDSELFLNCLENNRLTTRTESSKTSSVSRNSLSSSTTELSHISSKNSYPIDKVLGTLRMFTKPNHYPHIKGNEYDINFSALNM